MDKVLYYLLLFIFALGGYLLKKYVFPAAASLQELDPETLSGLSKWAIKFCRAAKNMITEFTTGSQRRDWVMEQLTTVCQKLNIELSEQQKRALLEAAYDEMNAADATAQAAQTITYTGLLDVQEQSQETETRGND